MSGEPVQRVRIYLNELDLRDNQPHYRLVLERLQHEGATGATVLRGVTGFGPGRHMRMVGSKEALPLVIEWVDRIDRVARILPLLDDLVDDALVTVEEVRAYRARMRSGGPFGSLAISDLLEQHAPWVQPATSIPQAVALMLERRQSAVPIIAQQQVVGLLTSTLLQRQVNLLLPLSIMQMLPPNEQADLVRMLPDRPVGSLPQPELHTAYIQAAIPQVVATLIEWELESLPVVDHGGQYVGMFGESQALQAALRASQPAQQAVQNAEAPAPLRLLMQTRVPTLPASTAAVAALTQLLALPDRFAVVVAEGKPVGILEAHSLIEHLATEERHAWLQALQRNTPDSLAIFAPERQAHQLVRPVTPLAELATQSEALTQLCQNGVERLVIVNDAGQLVGLLSRRGMLRSLAQLTG